MQDTLSPKSPDIFITECPRDAMQGFKNVIPTSQKIDYLNQLLKVGYDTLDAGSFVSHTSVPQLADTEDVLSKLEDSKGTKISVIVGGMRGAMQAANHERVDILGFPFSISENFQIRNTRKGRIDALKVIDDIQNLCVAKGKICTVYISMAFGNPYTEAYSDDLVLDYIDTISKNGISRFLISDTIGVGTPEQIHSLFTKCFSAFPNFQFSAHFHNPVDKSYDKLKAAWEAGCRHFDTAIKGIGGCPFATDELIGNMPTEQIINFMAIEKINNPLNLHHFQVAYNKAKDIFLF